MLPMLGSDNVFRDMGFPEGLGKGADPTAMFKFLRDKS